MQPSESVILFAGRSHQEISRYLKANRMSSSRRLIEAVAAFSGLTESDKWLTVLDNVTQRMTHAQTDSYVELESRIESEPALLRELVGALTVGETYFFRHQEHFLFLAEYLRRRLEESPPGRGMTVWSAGCASGEEPYSVAIAALESVSSTGRERLAIVGTDVNRAAIEAARRGVYSGWSFRGAPPALRDRHFTSVPNGVLPADAWQLADHVRRMVHFEHLSVFEQLTLFQPGTVDVILFRNVAIYMDPVALQRLYGGFARVLAKDGVLVIAPADPPPPPAVFHVEEDTGARVYRHGPLVSLCDLPSGPRVAASPRKRSFRRSDTIAPRTVHLAPSAMRMDLVERGKAELASGDFERATGSLRRALFMDGKSGLARYWYAVALRWAGRFEQSRVQLRELSKQLGALPATMVLEDGRSTVAQLLTNVQALDDVPS